jgi:hypothetical protein
MTSLTSAHNINVGASTKIRPSISSLTCHDLFHLLGNLLVRQVMTPRSLQVVPHSILPRRLAVAILERASPLTPGKSSRGRNWDVLGNIRAIQLMSDSKVLLVTVPVLERDVSTSVT